MAILDFISKQFIDIIEWTDDSRDTLSYRFPDDDRAIKNGAQRVGLESPFKADVYFVVTRVFTGNKWGTANPVMMRDQDFGIVRLRAYGTYDFRIVDVQKFLKEVAGTDAHFRLDAFN